MNLKISVHSIAFREPSRRAGAKTGEASTFCGGERFIIIWVPYMRGAAIDCQLSKQ